MTPLKPTRAEFHAWLDARGLAHLGRLNLEAAAPFVDRALWPRLRDVGARRRLSELASTEGVARATKDWLTDAQLALELPRAVGQVIDLELQNLELARAQVAARVAAPTDARAHPLHARLLVLRARLTPSIAPRLEALLPLAALELDATLPGFQFRDLLPSEQPLRAGGGFAHARVRLALGEVSPGASCSCGAAECVHQLAAIDTALLALRAGLEANALAVLTRPAWHRSLAALQEVFASSPPPTAPAEPRALSFRLAVSPAGDQVTVSGWFGDEPARLSPTLDASHVALIAALPQPGEAASRVMLEALVGHPRVSLADTGRPVRIERAMVGLAAEDRLGTVRLTAALDGAPMPQALAERVRRAKPDDPLWLWDEGPRVLTLIDVKPEVRAALDVLHREGASFPPEGQVALLESLSVWSHRVPVAMPRSVMGETVASQRRLVVRLEARTASGAMIELRVRPLPDAPALFPGVGSKDVYLRRADRAVHTVRDLAQERAAALELAEALRLPAASALSEWQFDLERAEDAFLVLERCAHHPSAPELEWVGKPLRLLGTVGPRALRVQLDEKADWFEGLGELSVFGERVELARMVEALRRDSRFVEVKRGDFIELNEALRNHLAAMSAHAVPHRGGLRFGPAAVEVLRALRGAGASVEGDAGWAALEARAERARSLEPVLPSTVRATLRPYQLDAFRWLMRLAEWGAGGVLADDMGLGKTLQALAVLAARAGLGPRWWSRRPR